MREQAAGVPLPCVLTEESASAKPLVQTGRGGTLTLHALRSFRFFGKSEQHTQQRETERERGRRREGELRCERDQLSFRFILATILHQYRELIGTFIRTLRAR
ncbi:conserved domain protein [Trichinella spiralis]|uniref:hypothetical protein n=1 Tax=Trichinella spiralis TaxID=6334 RepID=UPI0001EFEE8C|nr:conserved domain protein [Trichinella spiralis]